jgi:hypothetical protein
MEWLESLQDEALKTDEGLKKFDSVEALAKSYKNLESLSRNSIRIVGPDASDEDRAAAYQKVMKHMPQLVLKPNPDSPEQSKEFYQMLGVPDDIDGYTTDGVELDQEIITELRNLASETKMTKAQWKRYAELMSEMQAATNRNREDARIRAGAELKTEWGMAFEDRYAVVENFIKENEGIGKIEHMGPEQIKAMYSVAISQIGTKQAFGQPTTETHLSPDEAKARIKEIDNNPKFRSSNPADRDESMRLAKERVELLRASNPARYAQ